MRLEYLVLLIGYIISLCVGGLYFTTGNILVVLSGVISSVISGATALFLAKRSQIQKNTQAIRDLERRLGLNDEKTLRIDLMERFASIEDDLGRKKNDSVSLTRQHQDMQNYIVKIQEHLLTEEEKYSLFKKEQYDIKKTVDMFSRDYAETLKKNAELADENKRLIQENTSLRAEIEMLENKQTRAKKQEQNIGEGKSPRLIL